MFVVNPPWKLAETLKETLPYLVTLLRKDQEACFTVETGENNSRQS
jgi:23S rRNA (adenine2030-N6)-methyltransferase